MFTKSKCLFLSLALAFSFVLTGCEDLYTEQTAAVDSAAPEITQQPVGGSYPLGASATLTVTAAVTDGGTLSYRWFKANDEEYALGKGGIIGSNKSSYTIDLDEGPHYVYVLVTNTRGAGRPASEKSDLVRVLINDPDNAQYPFITGDPAGSAYNWPNPGTIDPISVTVDPLTDGGALSYQWYSADAYTATTGTPISGATAESYKPEIIAAGTFYYYVAVTNTNPGANKNKTAVVYSSPAVIKAVEANATITVSGAKAQYVRGFGVMANFWGNSPDVSMEDYEKMFNPKVLGCNMLRIMVPVDDDDSGSTNMRVIMKKTLKNGLSGDKDRSNYYDMVKLVNKYGGYVLASPWSPPAAWKTNNSKNGGGSGAAAILKKEYWMDYADYLREYCKIMYENGAPIYAVSIQNEPNFPADYDGCEWTGAEMRDFFKQVGRFTEGVKGWGGGKATDYVLTMNGESANTPTLNNQALADKAAQEYIDVFARHLYGNAGENISAAVQALGKEIWMTEYNVNGGNVASYPNDSTYNYMWKFANTIDCVIRINRENAFIWWYGKRFYSMIGDGEHGTVDGAILPRGWVLSHYAKFASETDQVGLTITGSPAGGGSFSAGNFNNTSYNLDSTAAKAAAFMSKDGNSISLVLLTPTNTSGSGGVDMGDIKIVFPAGFTASKVAAMRSRGPASGESYTENMGKADTDAVLLKDGSAAFVNLPAGQILSVKFTK